MVFCNCRLDEFGRLVKDKKIVFFGKGSWLSIINHTPIMDYHKQFAYVVDNSSQGNNTKLGEIPLKVENPKKIISEKEGCIIVLTSPVYMYEMYTQLSEMQLGDEFVCVAFPFMQMITNYEIDEHLCKKVISNQNETIIPKIIHSFWFSGDEKPKAYQKCVDTWKEKLSDYQIIEWNMDNYDCNKHPFVKKAIEEKAWAFASDYARLDVLYEYGGIYLDMDVEVFKTFDDLLGNEALLSFSNNVQVDLAFIGAKKNNELIRKLIHLYDDISIPETKQEFAEFFQPAFVRECLVENGVKMNGNLQIVKDATVFPKNFFMPLDQILFREYTKTNNMYCVHYDNFGWSFSKDSKRDKKIRDNNELWKMLKGACGENSSKI